MHPSSLMTDVAVPGRNQTLSCRVFQPWYSPLRNHSMASYGVGGGTHMQQKQTTLLQMPQVQLPLKAEGGGDSDTKAIQKGRKRPLSHSGSVSSTDNPGKTA